MDENTRKHKKKLIIQLLPKKNYHIGKVLKAVGISRMTFKRWRDEDVEFNEECEEVFQYDVDDSEEKLKLLRAGIPEFDKETGKFIGWKEKPHFGALVLHLKAKAKDRGYGDSLEIADKRNKESLRKMSDEELFNEIQKLNKIYNEEGWDISKDGKDKTD